MMKLLLLGTLCTSLAAASSLAHDAHSICGTLGGLSKPSCVAHGSHIALDNDICRASCILDRRCASFSYDTFSKICRLYTQSLVQQGFVASELSSTSYWQRECHHRAHTDPHWPHNPKATPTKTCSSTKTSASSMPTYKSCTVDDTYDNGFTNGDFQDGLTGWTETTNGCDPKSVTATYEYGALIVIPEGQVITSSLSQTIVGCNGVGEYVFFTYYLLQGGPGCVFTATAPSLGQFATDDFQYYDPADFPDFPYSRQVIALGSEWGPGPDSTAQPFPVTMALHCNGSQAATNMTLRNFVFVSNLG